MTDTEARVLALELRGHACKFYNNNMTQSNLWSALITAADYIEREEAAEARHAAELLQLKERFSEVAKEAHESLDGYSDFSPAGHARKILAPFIIAAPDPLFEAMQEVEPMTPWEMQDAKALRAAIEARGGKIVWEEGE